MLDKCIKLINRAIKKLKRNETSTETPILCVAGQFSIQLPANHMLPVYKQHHKLYDSFLPHLVSFFNNGDVVVDVGANCGDSLAAMVTENPRLNYICIEPDDDFYRYLEVNTALIKKTLPDLKIQLEKCLISNFDISSGLSGVGGTKHRDDALINNNKIKSRPLSAILNELDLGKNLRLIKSDVDGYDYEVIHSAGKWLNNSQVMLFFECQYFDNTQRDGFVLLLKELSTLGFSDFWFFDNFGGFLLNSKDSNIHNQLIDYIWRQNTEQYTRTVNYLDILVSKPIDFELVNIIVNQYVEGKLL